MKFDELLLRDVKAKLIRGSVSDIENLHRIVEKEKVSAILHLAALLSSDAEKNPEKWYEVNIHGTWNVFNITLKYKLPIIFASSIAAYGTNIPEIVSEEIYTLPTTLYGVSKQFGEMLGFWLMNKHDIDFVAFRFASVIGPGRKNGGASAYTTLMIQKPAQGEKYVAYVDENTTIPIAYIKDVSALLLKTLENFQKVKGIVYNIASLFPSPSAKEIANVVEKKLGKEMISFKPKPDLMKILNSWPKHMNYSKIINDLGWSPAYTSIEKIVEDFINEVQTKRIFIME